MTGTVSIDIARYNHTENHILVRSHVLHPHDDITLLFILSGNRESVLSVLEDHLLESISSTEWNLHEEEGDFSYVTERYNHFLGNLAEVDQKSTHALFGVIKHDILMLSVAGEMSALMCEAQGVMHIITEGEPGKHTFENISSGTLPPNAQIFLISKHLDAILGEDFFDECTHIDSERFETIITGTLEREHSENVHIIRLSKQNEDSLKHTKRISGSSQVDVAKGVLADFYTIVSQNNAFRKAREMLGRIFERHSNIILISFLAIGSILFIALVYTVIQAFFGATSNPSTDAKNEILRAKTLIEESEKLTSNQAAFNKSIKEAETILYALQDNKLYLKDTQELLQKAEAMKKELYDIQSVDVSKKENIVKLNASEFSPLSIFESNKKLNLIGKQGAIMGYIPGGPLPKISPYPPGEEGVHADFGDDGSIFISTKNNRILTARQNDFTYVTVTGQDTWETSERIKVFNSNIYLVNTTEGQIYKHRPGVNGFSQKSNTLTNPIPNMLDIGIDGGFYALSSDGKVHRILPNKNPTTIILNKVPGEYSLSNEGVTNLIVKPNLKYIYILNQGRIWIFEPDSKKFSDVRSWTYIAQFEIDTKEEIRSITVPRDGLIYLVTNMGVYDINFELVDKNIILR